MDNKQSWMTRLVTLINVTRFFLHEGQVLLTANRFINARVMQTAMQYIWSYSAKKKQDSVVHLHKWDRQAHTWCMSLGSGLYALIIDANEIHFPKYS